MGLRPGWACSEGDRGLEIDSWRIAGLRVRELRGRELESAGGLLGWVSELWSLRAIELVSWRAGEHGELEGWRSRGLEIWRAWEREP